MPKKSKSEKYEKSKKAGKSKKIKKIKKIKSKIKVKKPEPKSEKPEPKSNLEESGIGESGIEEKSEEAEQEIRSIGFQNFIQTSGSASSPSPVVISPLASEPIDTGIDTGFDSNARERDEQEREPNIVDYALPESSMEKYQEIVREQAKISSEVSPIRAQEVEISALGREMHAAIGTEARMLNPEEVMGMGMGGRMTGTAEDYRIMRPEKHGVDREKDTRPFQEDKKTYMEKLKE